MSESAKHIWTFFRFAGFDQVSITTAADIEHLPELDLKLWAALSCPVTGLECDERTLSLIDENKDGRVRAQELIAAITFLTACLKDLATIKQGIAQIELSAIRTDNPVGEAVQRCAHRLLHTVGRGGESMVRLEDVEKARDGFNKIPFNGDGIVPASSAGADEQLRQAILDIISTHGSKLDRNGEAGIDTMILDTFFQDAQDYENWWQETVSDPSILPVGGGTIAAITALDAVAEKIEDYFTRCRMTGFDSRSEAPLNRSLEDFQTIAKESLSTTSSAVKSFPLAHVKPELVLPLGSGINPGWTDAMDAFQSLVVLPSLGERSAISISDWDDIQARFAPTRLWLGRKRGTVVEKLGATKVTALLEPSLRKSINDLITQDIAFADEYDALEPVEKLLRLHRDLYRLLHNFINFSDFYSRERLADFQAGTLYLDGRSCELVIRVTDADRHAALAGMAKMYLAYCECRRASNEKMTIVAAFTAGDSDNLLVGRNGVFYDRQRRDWDATIVRVIENPISIRQAVFAPYKRVIRFVEETVAKRAASSDDATMNTLNSGISSNLQGSDKTPAQEPAKKLDLTLITGLGVVVAGFATAISGVLSAFLNLGPWIPLGFAGVLVAISTPSVLIAALKLRQRNLGPLLDANGWAVNGRVKITIPFGGTLTQLPHLPKNSTRSIFDPYAEKHHRWGLYVILALLTTLMMYFVYFRVVHKQWLWSPVIQYVHEFFAFTPSQDDIHHVEGLLVASSSYQTFKKTAANPVFIITKKNDAKHFFIVEIGDLTSEKLKPDFTLRLHDNGVIEKRDETKLGDAQWVVDPKP